MVYIAGAALEVGPEDPGKLDRSKSIGHWFGLCSLAEALFDFCNPVEVARVVLTHQHHDELGAKSLHLIHDRERDVSRVGAVATVVEHLGGAGRDEAGKSFRHLVYKSTSFGCFGAVHPGVAHSQHPESFRLSLLVEGFFQDEERHPLQDHLEKNDGCEGRPACEQEAAPNPAGHSARSTT